MKSSKFRDSHNVRSEPPNATETARLLNDLGFAICRIDPREKKPNYPNWPTRSLDADDIGPDDLIGILGGPLSHGNRPGHATVILDLDTPEAVGRAEEYLPSTGMVEGRPGKRKSHWYYSVPLASIPMGERSTAAQAAPAAVRSAGHPGPRTRSYRDAGRQEILRVIGTGGQAVCPPSSHPSGERRAWVGPQGRPGRPSVVEHPTLLAAIERLAATCGWHPTAADGGANTSSGVSGAARLDGWLEHRIEKYLEKCPPAESGRGGHDQLFSVAVALVHGFALDPETALSVLMAEYNPRCRPAWTVAELRHKVEDAVRGRHDKPRGHLVSSPVKQVALAADTPDIIRAAFAATVTRRVARATRSNRRGSTR